MSDPHDAQDYTANGPTDIGFRTGGNNTGITNGVVAYGTEFGVRGIGVGTERSDKRAYGVFGEGIDGGVVGQSGTGTGVRGESRGMSAGVYGAGVPGVHGFSNTSAGIFGEFVGVQPFEGSGVHGKNDRGVGVQGESSISTGVWGHSKTGWGVHGSSNSSYGGLFSSNQSAQIRLVPATNHIGPPTTGQHEIGEFFVDRRGSLFYYIGSSPFGDSWVKLAGPPPLLLPPRPFWERFIERLGATFRR